MWVTRNLSNIIARSPLTVAFNCLRFGSGCPKYTTANISKKEEECKTLFKKTAICRPPKNFVSIWQDSDCGRCTRPCPQLRHDDLYLQPTDIRKRSWQQTWLDFPEMQKYIVECTPQRVANVVEPEKRILKKSLPPGKCSRAKDFAAFRKCRIPSEQACVRIKMKGCRQTRGSTRCTRDKRPTEVKKLCTPYPSYSECDWKKLKEIAYAHCKCMIIPMRCELYEHLEKEENINIKKPPKIPEPRTSLT